MERVLITVIAVIVCCSGCDRKASVAATLKDIEVAFSDDAGGGCSPEIMDVSKVRDLLRRSGVWQELVAVLDSTEPTKSTFEETEKTQPVPVGYLCLYILLWNVDDTYEERVFFDSASAALGSNVLEGYYFPPDIVRRPQAQVTMRSVKAAWQSLYEETRGEVFAPLGSGRSHGSRYVLGKAMGTPPKTPSAPEQSR